MLEKVRNALHRRTRHGRERQHARCLRGEFDVSVHEYWPRKLGKELAAESVNAGNDVGGVLAMNERASVVRRRVADLH